MKRGKYEAPRAPKRHSSKKALAMLLSLVLLIGCVVGGTLAWLVASSETVTNTFSVGDINITLSETTGTSYKILPGGTSAKDPTLKIQQGSEKCWVYVLIDNSVVLNGTVVATPNINENDWKVVDKSGTKTLYRYKDVVDASSAEQTLGVFTTVAYADTITKDNINTLKDTKIVITGYAHQSENTTQVVADAAAKAWAELGSPKTN